MDSQKEDYESQRARMVETQIEARGIKEKIILDAMRKVPRHMFVPDEMKSFAYHDEPLPIGGGQTISQPYIVAYMTEVLELNEEAKVLEVGTGSGYQTAVLAEMVKEVFTVEIISSLSLKAQEVLRVLGYANIQFKIGDGTLGWREYAPFDAILVTAAPSSVPRALEEQLKISGRMIIPVGFEFQELFLVSREKKKFRKKKLLPVRFVPLISVH